MANAVTNVGFTSPAYDYGSDVAAIERKRALAAQLQGEALKQPGGTEVVNGWAVRQSPFGGIAKSLAQMGAATVGQKKADEEQQSLAEKAQADYRQMLATGLKQLQGTPATPQAEDASGNVSAAQPAVPPDAAAALGTFGSHPMGAQFAPLAMQQMQRQQLADALRGGQGGSSAAPAPSPMQPGPGASVMAGSGPAPFQAAPQAQPQGAQTGGPAGGVPMAAWLMADPSGKTYMEQLAKDYGKGQEPVVNRGFGIGIMRNGQYVPDAASLQQAMDLKRGEAGITAGSQVHPVQQAGGGTVPMFGSQLPGYSGMLRGIGAPAPAGAPVAAAPAPAPAPPPPNMLPAPAPRPALAAGAPQGDPWATMPKRIIPQGIGESTYNKATATQSAEAGAKIAEKLGNTAQTANERKSFNDQALQMLPQATTGPGALSITGMQSFLNSRFGIPLDQLDKATAGDAAATQELNKNLLNAATKTAKANYGSRMTQSEVMMQIKQGSPNVDMTRAAIGYLLNADNARANYEIKQGQDVGRYLQQGGDPYQFEGWYSRTFPMSGAIRAGAANPVKDIVGSGGNLSAAEQKELDDLRKRFGR